MPDREKVIADIEEQIAWIRDNDFHKFPGWGHAVLAMKDALAILKEQEAVVPGIAQDVDGIFATCGNCKKKLWKMMGLEFVVNPDEMPRFCPHCGKSVKWE